MRNAPMRWIEQAEHRQVVAQAVFERSPKEPWSELASDMAQWLPRLGTWLADRHPMGWQTPQLQPVPVRRPTRRQRQSDGDCYPRGW